MSCAPLRGADQVGYSCPSSSRSTRSTTLRPSPPSTMKVSPIGPSAAKPTKGELLARVETLSRKSRSVKLKALDSVEKDRPTWGKVPKLGASSSSPSTPASTPVRTPGKMLPSLVKVTKASSS